MIVSTPGPPARTAKRSWPNYPAGARSVRRAASTSPTCEAPTISCTSSAIARPTSCGPRSTRIGPWTRTGRAVDAMWTDSTATAGPSADGMRRSVSACGSALVTSHARTVEGGRGACSTPRRLPTSRSETAVGATVSVATIRRSETGRQPKDDPRSGREAGARHGRRTPR